MPKATTSGIYEAVIGGALAAAVTGLNEVPENISRKEKDFNCSQIREKIRVNLTAVSGFP